MAAAILAIKQWGNNLSVRLPAAVACEAHLRADQCVWVSVESGVVVITPVAETALTLEQRLALFGPVCQAASTWTACFEKYVGKQLCLTT